MEEDFDRVFRYFMPILVSVIFIRILYVPYWLGRPLPSSALANVPTLIVLGSGGHTAEMLGIINMLQKDRFSPRIYVAAATDSMSLEKAQVLEESLIQQAKVSFERIPDSYVCKSNPELVNVRNSNSISCENQLSSWLQNDGAQKHKAPKFLKIY